MVRLPRIHRKTAKVYDLLDLLAEDVPNSTHCMCVTNVNVTCDWCCLEQRPTKSGHRLDDVKPQAPPPSKMIRQERECAPTNIVAQMGDTVVRQNTRKYNFGPYVINGVSFSGCQPNALIKNNILNKIKSMNNITKNKFFTYRRLLIETIEIASAKFNANDRFQAGEVDTRIGEFGLDYEILNKILYGADSKTRMAHKAKQVREITNKRDNKRCLTKSLEIPIARAQGASDLVDEAINKLSSLMGSAGSGISQVLENAVAYIKSKIYDALYVVGKDFIIDRAKKLKWVIMLVGALLPVAYAICKKVAITVHDKLFIKAWKLVKETINGIVPIESVDTVFDAATIVTKLAEGGESIEDGSIVHQMYHPDPCTNKAWILEYLLKAIVGATGGTTALLSIKKAHSLMRVVSDIPRFAAGMSIIAEWMVTAFESVVNYVRINLLGYNTAYYVKTKLKLVDDYKEEVFSTYELFLNGKLPIGLNNKQVVDDLHLRGRSMLSDAKMLTSEPRIKTMIPNLLRLVDEMKAKMSPAESAIAGVKFEPLAILLTGKSGVGKSAMTLPFLSSLITLVGPDNIEDKVAKQQNAYIYSRNITTEFWDGYYGQFACVFDDFMQAVDGPGINSEALEIIKLVNTFPYSLHSASLEEKGNNYFNSRIVFCSTNNARLDTSAIREKEALYRRFDIVANIKPAAWASKNSQYGSHKVIDKEKLAEYGDSFNPNAIEVHVRNYAGTENTQIMSYGEFLIYATETYKKKERAHESRINDVTEHVKAAFKFRSMAKEMPNYKGNLTNGVHPQMAGTNDIGVDVEGLEDPIQAVVLCKDVYKSLKEPEVADITEEHAGAFPENIDEMLDTFINEELSTMNRAMSLHGEAKPVRKSVHEELASLVMDFCRITRFNAWQFQPSLIMFYKSLFDLHERIRLEYNRDIDVSEVASALLSDDVAQVLKTVGERANQTTPDEARPHLLARTIDSPFMLKFIMKKHGLSFGTTLAKRRAEFNALKDDVVSVLSKIKAQVGKTMSKIGTDPRVRTLATLSVVAAGIATTIAVGRFLFSDNDNGAIEQGSGGDTLSNDKHMSRVIFKNSKGKAPVRPTKRIQFQAGCGEDPNGFDIMKTIHKGNVYELLLPTSKGETKSSGFITIVCATYFIMPSHFSGKIQGCIDTRDLHLDDSVYLRQLETDQMIGIPAKTFSFNELVFLEGKDICMGNLGRLINPRPNIRKHFVLSKDVKKINNSNVNVWIPRGGWQMVHQARGQCLGVLNVENTNGIHSEYQTLVSYNVVTREGDCGSAISLNDKTARRKFIGIHIAGNGSTVGYGQITTGEDIDEMFRLMGIKEKERGVISQMAMPTYEIEEVDLQAYEEDRNMVKLTREVLPTSTYSVSKLKKTKLNHLCPLPLAPARLRNFTNAQGERVNPYENARSKYCQRKTWNPDYTALRYAIQQAQQRVLIGDLALGQHLDRRVVTFEEAIVGVAGADYFDSINRATSPGYPYNATSNNSNAKGKFGIFGNGPQLDITTPAARELRNQVNQYILSALNGESYPVYYTDTLKDELRPMEKVEAGATRLVSCSPLVLTTVTRMYFIQVCRHIYFNKVRNGIAVGINPTGDDWHTLKYMLSHKGPDNCFSGDFKNFDGSEQIGLLSAAGDILTSWYGLAPDHPDNVVRARIINDLQCSVHIRGGNVYAWGGSLASGNPLTSIVNSICNQIAFRYCWVRIIQAAHVTAHLATGVELEMVPNMDHYVYLCTYGDDNVLSVTSKYREVFTPEMISRTMRDLGLHLTNSDKSAGGVGGFTSIENIDFLKRKFKVGPLGMYVGALDLNSIYKSLAWTKEGGSEYAAIKETLGSVYLELAMHGVEVYNREVAKINEALTQSYHCAHPFVTWAETVDKAYPDGRVFMRDVPAHLL